RAVAPALHRALQRAARRIAAGEAVSAVEAEGTRTLLAAGFDAVDYFETRAPDTLARRDPGATTPPARILAAARLGRTRLLDNVPA
ncbi:MAG: pantoate--beta-alanine ligase, partial [Caulobacteraceae bacterium]